MFAQMFAQIFANETALKGEGRSKEGKCPAPIK
jgi:hypothetical protein